MTVCIGVICDALAYRDQPGSDVIRFYQALAREQAFESFHLPLPALRASLETGDLGRLPSLQLSDRAAATLWTAAPVRGLQPLPAQRFDLLFCRTLKPFPPRHLELLQQLEHCTRFLNRPSSKIRQLASWFLTDIAGSFTPPSRLIRSSEALADVLELWGDVVVKRPNSTQGRGVFRLSRSGPMSVCLSQGFVPVETLSSLEHAMALIGDVSEEWLAMPFLSGTFQGDKRVLVVDGEVIAGYRRRSSTGHWINNVSVDADCVLEAVSDDERAVVAATAPSYRSMGMRILGYDFLTGDSGEPLVSEINVGNIGGFSRVTQLGGPDAMHQLLGWMRLFAEAKEEALLEPAKSHHAAAMAAIYQQSVDQGGVTMDVGLITAGSFRQRLSACGERSGFWVLTLGAEVLGWTELRAYSPRWGYRFTAETSTYVHASARGRGFGSKLQRFVIGKAREMHYRHLVAKVVSRNEQSVAFHLRHGFERVGTQKEVGFLGNSWHDVVILQCLLV